MKELRIPKKDADELLELMALGDIPCDEDGYSRGDTSDKETMNVFGRTNDDIHAGDVYVASTEFDDGVTAELHVVVRPDSERNTLWLEACIEWYYPNGEHMNESEYVDDNFLGEWGYEGDDEHPDYSVNVVAVETED